MAKADYQKLNQPIRSIMRIIYATQWSMKGFESTLKTEEAFRQEVLLLIILAPLGIWLGDTGIERTLLIGTVLIVLIVELLNSAVESAIDRIGDEHHKLSGKAKDQGSAAVFVSLVLATMTWLFILIK
ncbi:diacylglycerol kinase [bacterium BMS3Bbin11]|nr:diacylglycerol kinase [bacterium BMS3Abin11]GBE46782.1 diacylglycerol kinase [bacterium BMS3Bbin11]GMT40371.1 MAG: diacylglycerol kinase [bacterium]HDH08987.1 diacylglycerol kinase [Gammaproteobacteria bacterium]HDH16351.1 diacylglycerol kinase [Gammaproteobacteria bacterium]